MAQKCVHKACGKKFTDPDEPCIYHPGPPEFHEGQKGWQCCKPRVLTFDEFLDIPPCTTGKHSTVDENPTAPTPKPDNTTTNKPLLPQTTPRPYIPPPTAAPPSSSTTSSTQPQPPPPPPPETDSDESSAPVPPNLTCKRRGCGASAPSDPSSKTSRDGETCIYHPGSPLFHEGSKGWTCCKRKVLEFDEFLRIEGCKTRNRHCFVGKKKTARRKPDGAVVGGGGDGTDGGVADADEEWEKVETVRSDFYQSPTQVQATIYLKKVDKAKSRIKFRDDGIGLELDLKTADGKRYAANWGLFGKVDVQKSSFAIKGTKVDLSLEKAEGYDWTRLRMDEPPATTGT